MATIILVAFYVYMIARPISYGMKYHAKTEYDGYIYEGEMTFNPDNSMVIWNNNINEEIVSYYYYKDGYVFFILAKTEAEYQEEVAWINVNWTYIYIFCSL